MNSSKSSLSVATISGDDYTKTHFDEYLQCQGYRLGKRIGSGSYSKVYFAEHKKMNHKASTNTTLACKVVDKRKPSKMFITKFLPRELKIIRTLQHPNICQVYRIIEHGPFVGTFMEFCPHGDMLERIQKNGPLSDHRLRLFFNQLVSALRYLHHAKGIAHRDIKCENILIKSASVCQLSDFGFAREIGNKISDTFCGSAAYAAPEVLKGLPYDPKMYDMWSLGCVLFIMATAQMPFDEENLARTLRHQERRHLTFPKNRKINSDVVEIIRMLLHPDVSQRATCRTLASHQWIY